MAGLRTATSKASCGPNAGASKRAERMSKARLRAPVGMVKLRARPLCRAGSSARLRRVPDMRPLPFACQASLGGAGGTSAAAARRTLCVPAGVSGIVWSSSASVADSSAVNSASGAGSSVCTRGSIGSSDSSTASSIGAAIRIENRAGMGSSFVTDSSIFGELRFIFRAEGAASISDGANILLMTSQPPLLMRASRVNVKF